ncbi:hypothetical protein L593_13505 [Salinarchaeum sp. Harcht-Bsk1]|uniref:hypothetical protein n=1 Tax=Salinarchaeum sp. Harcht-Bsk1 TaxID=1333523 RepID=UPI0003423241|nr:hypothetical protein [Salinarchaeum sp. Harcht-Bsk1]AGN02640.1 hypothetical protein L593_13505 [Salinarchaeum sp. Harcht-Bsk1]
MLEWEATESGFRVHDSAGAECSVGGSQLEFTEPERELPRPVDITLDCLTTELTLPGAVVYLISLTSGETEELPGTTEPKAMPEGEYLVDVDAEVKTYLRLTGPFTLCRTADYDGVVLSVPARRRITLGFRSRNRKPTAELTIPPTPEGVATALTYSSAAHKTTGTDRSYPTLRGHPPLLEIADETADVEVPSAIREARDDTGIELLAPNAVESLLVLAPLAYYIGADVQVGNVASPILRAPDADVAHELPAMPDLERDATRLLRKVFFLDCLVRNAGPYDTELAEASLLDALGVDAETLYAASPADRLAAYLDVPYGAIEQRLPDWHCSTYVEPDRDGLRALPFLLDRMSLIYMPRTSELEGSELVERSLDDFYRGRSPEDYRSISSRSPRNVDTESAEREEAHGARSGDRTATSGDSDVRSAGDVASVDVLKPELRGGRIHGWLAEGTPIDVFNCLPEAFEHRIDALDRAGDGIDIAVVRNDAAMEVEHADVADIYRTRGADVSIDVSVHERLSTTELARLFEAEYDFAHYIGHCETGGFRCPDGHLSASSLTGCGLQTFFLNACGSYHEGVDLVRQGAVAGAVTFSQVLNDHAVSVGSTFAKLLVHGFGFERALQLARRRIMMGKDYAVVGDGTHSLAQSENRLPATVELESVEAGFLLTYDQFSSRHAGAFYRPYLGEDRYAYLCGNESDHVLDRSAVAAFLERAALPVIYDGDVYWSDDLADRIRSGH